MAAILSRPQCFNSWNPMTLSSFITMYNSRLNIDQWQRLMIKLVEGHPWFNRYRGLISINIFQRNSNLMEILYFSGPYFNTITVPRFGAWHDSCVIFCISYSGIDFSYKGLTVELQIWTSVKRAPISREQIWTVLSLVQYAPWHTHTHIYIYIYI